MLAGVVARARSLWQGVRRRAELDAEMAEEFHLHMELRAADLVRAGMTPAEAARQARLEFGSAERYKDEGRRSRGLRPFDDLRLTWLDFKLGFRMLVRYPGLTLVGGLALAFAIWVGAGAFELARQVLHPVLPLHEGHRIVGIQNWDAAESHAERRSLHDFAVWRAQLRTVQDLGAYRDVRRNLITTGGIGEPVQLAEISASAFRVTRVPPLLGRPLVGADERPGAPPVVVLGHDLWQRRFGGDSAVVGRTVGLGHVAHTVVGVMPEGFAFPVAHQLWTPLRVDPLEVGPREGPAVRVFGRLAPGATLDIAQAELEALGRRAALHNPDTHRHLRPRVLPYANSILELDSEALLALLSGNIPLLLLLVLVCGNVALLMFARAATREGEIAVRTALGASRRRIVMQLFAEALVLGGVAAVVALVAVGFGMRWVMAMVSADLLNGAPFPFWFRAGVSLPTVLYTAVLTLLGAVVAGVVPALKVTRGVGSRLKQATAGGGGLRFGGVWTAVIVTQVAVTVTFPAIAFFLRRDAAQIETLDVGVPTQEYLTARLEMDREPPPGAPADTSQAAFRARFTRVYEELERRLLAEPGVTGVIFADRLPRMYHPHRLVDVDPGGAAPLRPEWPAYRVSSASVDPDFFRTLGAPILQGRGFHAGDLPSDEAPIGTAGAAPGVVVVNESFVKLVLGGRNPIGRRVRYVLFEDRWPRAVEDVEAAPWYEIVGVVPDLGTAVGADVGQRAGGDPKVAAIYHPARPGDAYPAQIGVHVRGDPLALAPRLRALAAATDPSLRLYGVKRLDQVNESELRFLRFWFQLVLMVSAVALLLALAGIYAVMAFTVSRRTREIGIRVALGAAPRRVVVTILARPLRQVGLGILAGGGLTALLTFGIYGASASARQGAILAAYAALMTGVCLLACIVPTRRALRVDPMEALRVDG